MGTGKEGYDRNKNMIISFTWVEGKFCLTPAIEISFFCCIILKAIQFFSLSVRFFLMTDYAYTITRWICTKKAWLFHTHWKWNKSFSFIFAGFWGLFCWCCYLMMVHWHKIEVRCLKINGLRNLNIFKVCVALFFDII